MKMNGELRNKQSMMQAQLKSTAERKVDVEIELSQKQKEIEQLVTQLEQAKANTAPNTVRISVDVCVGVGLCVSLFVCFVHSPLSRKKIS